MTYTVIITRPAEKALADLDAATFRRAMAAINALANEPRPPRCAKMAGTVDEWRIKVGTYRIVYAVQDDRVIIYILRVGHRQGVYRR